MKKFDELRVVDLKAELEKRGLDKSGVKATLIDRLRKAILDDDENPDETIFDSSTTTMKSSSNNNNLSLTEDENYSNGIESEACNSQEKEDNMEEVNEEVLKVQEDTAEETEENTEEQTGEDNEEQTEEDIMGEITIQDDPIDLLLEDEDKLLDYEENYRMDMDDNGEEKGMSQNILLYKENSENNNEAKVAEKEENNSSDATKEESMKRDGEKSTCNLWVSGLRQSTKAQDLRTIFLKHGKVLSVKIVTNAKSTTGRCFGFITMANKEAAENCISNLHQTEINGRIILVELAKGDLGGASKASSKIDNKDDTSIETSDHTKRNDDKRKDTNSEKNCQTKSKDRSRLSRSQSRSRTREHRVSAKDRVVDRRHNKIKDNYRSRSPRKDVLNLRKIENERVKQRQRTRERLMREEERRRRDEDMHRKNLERRQREEGLKLQREREKLRMERERLEREKQELVRIEREQQKLERERIQREREEIRRQALKYEEVRRGLKRPSDERGERDRDFYDQRNSQRTRPSRTQFESVPSNSSHRYEEGRRGLKRPADERERDRDFYEQRKRPATDNRTRFEAISSNSSHSRFTTASMNQSIQDSWRPSRSGHGNKPPYGGTSSVIMQNPVTGVARSGESQGGWRSSGNLSGERWNSNTNVATRSGQTLLEMMHRGSEQHHVSPPAVNSHQTMPMLSSMQQNDRFSSINYRNF